MTEGWQPIATAPKDRAVLLAWPAVKRPRAIIGWQQPIAVVNPEQLEWAFEESHGLPAGWSSAHPPTHWQPLPDMPEEYAWGNFPEAAE